MASKGVVQFPAINSPQRAGRGKVALKPGRSLMNWIQLTHSEADLSGLKGKVLDVTAEELSKHNKKNDAWICLKGKVYNITPYMEYHPGGEDELMRGAGRDATELFNQIHKWVNAESMLQKCFIGKMKMSSLRLQRATSLSKRLLSPPTNIQQKTVENIVNKGDEIDNLQLPSKSEKHTPKYDWFQSDSTVSLVIYTKWKDIQQEHVIVDLKEKCLRVNIRIEEYIYQLYLDLEDAVSNYFEVKVGSTSGAVEILFTKENCDTFWQNLGTPLKGHNSFTKIKESETFYRPGHLTSKTQVTHDTFLFTFCLPPGTRMLVPLGHHVHLRKQVDGIEVVRSYTPVLPSMDVSQENVNTSEECLLHLMVKIYPNGVFTPILNKIEVGETLDISDYEGDFVHACLEKCSTLVLIAAGTGFTPMVRLIYWVLMDDKNIQRTIKLLFFNKTEEDILWRGQLEKLSEEDRLQVKYVLSEPSQDWSGDRGRISKQVLETFIPPESAESKLFICVCGPTLFTKTALEYLDDLGYGRETVHAFLG